MLFTISNLCQLYFNRVQFEAVRYKPVISERRILTIIHHKEKTSLFGNSKL